MVIVYRSNTGFTKQYAELLSQETGLSAYEYHSAPLDYGASIIYMGPITGGHIDGLWRAYQQYNLVAVCGVGMAPKNELSDASLHKSNYVHADVPLFYLPGGWSPKEVPVPKREIVKLVTGSLRHALQKKGSKRTPEEQAYLELLTVGGSMVSPEHLSGIRAWIEEQKSRDTDSPDAPRDFPEPDPADFDAEV